MMKEKRTKRVWRVIAVIALALSMLISLAAFTACSVPAEEPVARSYQTKCYATNGGDKWVCADGGEMEFQSGSTLDIQSTAVMTIGGGLAIDGALDLDGELSSGTGCITVADCLNTTGAVDFDGTLNVDGATTVADDFIVTAQTAVSVTAEGGVITPTGTYQPLESAADYSSTLSTDGFTAGTLLVLVNTVSHRLGITDTGAVKLSGNLYLDQYDSAILWFDGTNWIQLAESDN